MKLNWRCRKSRKEEGRKEALNSTCGGWFFVLESVTIFHTPLLNTVFREMTTYGDVILSNYWKLWSSLELSFPSHFLPPPTWNGMVSKPSSTAAHLCLPPTGRIFLSTAKFPGDEEQRDRRQARKGRRRRWMKIERAIASWARERRLYLDPTHTQLESPRQSNESRANTAICAIADIFPTSLLTGTHTHTHSHIHVYCTYSGKATNPTTGSAKYWARKYPLASKLDLYMWGMDRWMDGRTDIWKILPNLFSWLCWPRVEHVQQKNGNCTFLLDGHYRQCHLAAPSTANIGYLLCYMRYDMRK